jgi:predicted transcriptional regulator
MKNMKKKLYDSNLHVKMSKDMHCKLELIAIKRNVTSSQVIRTSIDDLINKEFQEYGRTDNE